MSIYFKINNVSKLQRIDRKNGSSIYLLYLPKEMVEMVGFKKGDEVKVTAIDRGIYIENRQN